MVTFFQEHVINLLALLSEAKAASGELLGQAWGVLRIACCVLGWQRMGPGIRAGGVAFRFGFFVCNGPHCN